MSNSTLQHVNSYKQDCQEGKFTMKGLAFTNLLHTLIREYGCYHDGSYSVDVDSFSISDKRLLISYFESAEWYEYACESAIKTESLFSDHSKELQKLFDDESNDVYKEDMEEMSGAI